MNTEARIIELVSKVCEMNKDSVQQQLEYSAEVRTILRSRTDNRTKTRLLFTDLMWTLSYQGIGDQVVDSYMEGHGAITYFQIARRLNTQRKRYGPLCSKLKAFDFFKGCGYRKAILSCNNRRMLMSCPLRRHDLLKGVLNVKAYSFFFYIRDVCQGDLISHIDQFIKSSARARSTDPSWVFQAKAELIKDFTRIFGVGDKLANMTLCFLLSADPSRTRWVKVGQAMVAIDTLVHNFLQRTGILRFYDLEHNYGPACPIRCFAVIDTLSKQIDASQFNPDYPKYYPRFIQFSIWKFCSVMIQDICNGVKIDDSKPCQREDICPVYDLCDRIALRKKNKEISHVEPTVK